MSKLQLNRGLLSNKPILAESELYYATDTAEVYIGIGNDDDQVIFGIDNLLDPNDFQENDFIGVEMVDGELVFTGRQIQTATDAKRIKINFSQSGQNAPIIVSTIENTSGISAPTPGYLPGGGAYTFTFPAPLSDQIENISVENKIVSFFGFPNGYMMWDIASSTTSVISIVCVGMDLLAADDLFDGFVTLDIAIKTV